MLEQLKDKNRFENPKKGKEVVIFEMPVPKDIKKIDDFERNRSTTRDLYLPPSIFNRRMRGINSCIVTTNSLIYAAAKQDDRVIDYV